MPPRGQPRRKTTQGNVETRAGFAPMISAAIEQLITQRVADAIAYYEANRNNEAVGNNGASNTTSGMEDATRGCSYKEFLNFKPGSFSGTEGVVGLVHWFERLESVFRIGNCTEGCKVKYATCTLQDNALTWWISYVQSVGIDAAYRIPWEDLKQMMNEEYCSGDELQKLEIEFLNLSVKGTDIAGYTKRFQQLALLCPTMVIPEYKRIEKYIWGLTPQIQGMVTSSKPTTIQGTIHMAHDLMDQMVRQGATMAKDPMAKYLDGKRKWEDDQEGNFEQLIGRMPEDVRAYVVGPRIKKEYLGNYPYCNQCNRHHPGYCNNMRGRCNKPGHRAEDCRSLVPVINVRMPKGCFECGSVKHLRKKCPRLRNQNARQARGKAIVVKTEDDHQDL